MPFLMASVAQMLLELWFHVQNRKGPYKIESDGFRAFALCLLSILFESSSLILYFHHKDDNFI